MTQGPRLATQGTSDAALPSVTGMGYADVPGRDGYEFRAVGAGPSDTYNYWQVAAAAAAASRPSSLGSFPFPLPVRMRNNLPCTFVSLARPIYLEIFLMMSVGRTLWRREGPGGEPLQQLRPLEAR